MCGVINISDIKIGDVYGDNTIVGEVKDERKDGRRVWLCKCKCGNIKKKSTKYAKQGRTCGYLYENNLYKNDIRKKLFIDMDGVIFNTIKTIVNIYNYDYKYYEDFIEVDSNEVNTWDFKECNCATKEAIDLYFNQPRFFNNLILMDNAIETINRLEKKFCIILVSMGSEENLLLKQIWVNKNIPGVKFIGVSFKEHLDKSHIDMSDGIFIDDSVKNLETSNAIENICFGDLYEWNKCWNGKRCFNWTELEKYIEEVYENHKL